MLTPRYTVVCRSSAVGWFSTSAATAVRPLNPNCPHDRLCGCAGAGAGAGAGGGGGGGGTGGCRDRRWLVHAAALRCRRLV